MNRPTSFEPVTQPSGWKALFAHREEVEHLDLKTLFAEDPERGERLTLSALGLFLDYSKNRITEQTLELLFNLAKEMDLSGRIAAMFEGEKINPTENRAALHAALRAPEGSVMLMDGQDVVFEVQAELRKMTQFSDRIRSGQWKGHTGKPIKTSST